MPELLESSDRQSSSGHSGAKAQGICCPSDKESDGSETYDITQNPLWTCASISDNLKGIFGMASQPIECRFVQRIDLRKIHEGRSRVANARSCLRSAAYLTHVGSCNLDPSFEAGYSVQQITVRAETIMKAPQSRPCMKFQPGLAIHRPNSVG